MTHTTFPGLVRADLQLYSNPTVKPIRIESKPHRIREANLFQPVECRNTCKREETPCSRYEKFHYCNAMLYPPIFSPLKRLCNGQRQISELAVLSNHVSTNCNVQLCTRLFKYDRDCGGLFTHKSVPVIFEPPCTFRHNTVSY